MEKEIFYNLMLIQLQFVIIIHCEMIARLKKMHISVERQMTR